MSEKPSRPNNLLSSTGLRKQSEFQNKSILNLRSSVFLLVLLGSWLLISYLAVSWFTNRRLITDLQQHSIELNQSMAAVTYHFERSLAFLNVMPATIANDMVVITALRSFDMQSLSKRIIPGDKRSYTSSLQNLAALNLHLAAQAKDLDVDIIWILADNGDCIASSNYDQPESFVGVNYADRAYFKSALSGLRGRQYAVGRQTNIPGLFFSTPIYTRGKVSGAVVLKIDMTRLSKWFNRFNCFVTDAEGVIILANDKGLEHKALLDAPVFRMSSAARDNQYKRHDFSILKIGNFGDKFLSYPAITLPGNDSRYMLAQSQQNKDGYTIFTYSKVPEVEQLHSVQFQLTILVFISGAALILLVAGIRRYLSDMRVAIAMAKASSIAKSQFLATISHEIRTPMNGILGMTDLLCSTNLNKKQYRFAEAAHHSAETLLSLLNDILDFSKMEAGKLRLEIIYFNLHETVEDVISLFTDQASHKGLELTCLLDQDVPVMVAGDPMRLRQILTNLIGNAVKFTSHGEVSVTVKLVSADDGAGPFRFEVRDTGVGMTPEQMTSIFDAFSQADGSTTRRFGGTGLGLTISKQLVEMMGGEIDVHSEPGEGSTFWFTISLKPSSNQQAPLFNAQKELTGHRVLIVDDNETNRTILSHQVTAWGMSNDSAVDGNSAIELLGQEQNGGAPFDIAIIDMAMPGMNGLQLANIIKDNCKISNITVIILSSVADVLESTDLEQAGISICLTKPVRRSHLYNALLSIIAKDHAVCEFQNKPRSISESSGQFPCNILLVEDNLVNQEVSRHMLESLGCHVDIAENGEEAVEITRQRQYAAIFMDGQMPVMDGYEATRIIRQAEAAQTGQLKSRHTPIIALTAHAMQGDREGCLDAGMDDYLPKPFNIPQLAEVLRRWVDKAEAVSAEKSVRGNLKFLPQKLSNAIPYASPEANDLMQKHNAQKKSIDQKALQGIKSLQRPGNPDLLNRMITLYLDDSVRKLKELRSAVEAKEASAVHKIAHGLKSASANLGATTLSSLFKEMEMMGKSHEIGNAETLLSQIEAEYLIVKGELEIEMRKGTS